ncbi:unnamed protein product [marine sediment metagenome]|uniref:Uncharacterized protein n=1 Tax=marine sediment metagenome TaxID=412755 RepID=X1HXD8_9ZZZZ
MMAANVTGVESYLEGTALTEASSSSAVINTASGGTIIGGYNEGANAELNGDIVELFVYNTELNNAQRIIIENYLGAKYNLTVANDNYDYQNTHYYDLAGIGRIDASNQHTAGKLFNCEV